MSLDNYTDQALMDELLNRRFEREQGHDGVRYCVECTRFVPWQKRSDPPDTYNPCSAGHKMNFRMPEEWEGPHGEYGFYRRICSDRALPAPPPKPKPPEPPKGRQDWAASMIIKKQ